MLRFLVVVLLFLSLTSFLSEGFFIKPTKLGLQQRRVTKIDAETTSTVKLSAPGNSLKKEISHWADPIPYSKLTIGVPKENGLGEKRVALTPKAVGRLIQEGFTVRVEKNSGIAANYPDVEYEAVGAKVVWGNNDIWKSDIVVKVQPPTTHEAKQLGDRALVSFFQPGFNRQLIQRLQQQGSTVFAMDCVPRFLSRAQAFDALSSQATVAGYRAVVECMYQLEGFFPPLATPAGGSAPAKVLVLGAGVAGIAAISTAKNMGAEVYAYDVRDTVRPQVESAGGFFLQVPVVNQPESDLLLGGNKQQGGKDAAAVAEYKKAEADAMHVWTSEADIIITTALIPGRQAPKLVTWQMVKNMKHGADMAASLTGGNVEGSIPDEINVGPNNVKIIGYTDLPSRMATSASSLYANNIVNFLLSAGPGMNPSLKGKFFVDYEDPAVREMLILDKGDLRWPNPNPFIPTALVEKQEAAVAAANKTVTTGDLVSPPVTSGSGITSESGLTGVTTGVEESELTEEEKVLQIQIEALEAELGKYEE